MSPMQDRLLYLRPEGAGKPIWRNISTTAIISTLPSQLLLGWNLDDNITKIQDSFTGNNLLKHPPTSHPYFGLESGDRSTTYFFPRKLSDDDMPAVVGGASKLLNTISNHCIDVNIYNTSCEIYGWERQPSVSITNLQSKLPCLSRVLDQWILIIVLPFWTTWTPTFE